MNTFARLTVPGLLLTAAIACAALQLASLNRLAATGISALTLAIVIGMVVGNTFYPRLANRLDAGVAFSKQRLLRLGIIVYGLRLTFQDIAGVGIAGVIIDAIVLSSTFGLAWWAGTRLFGLDRTTALLIGAGSSICGAAAVMAAEPVVRGRADQVTVAVATVVVFGTLAIFVYPALFHLANHARGLALSPRAYGIYAGSTIHEVAQVVAAGRAISDAAANTAVITKMVRVMMLAPFLLLLSTYLSRGARQRNDAPSATDPHAALIVVPWFAVGFIAVAALNSLAHLPAPFIKAATSVDTVMLAMAMAALGLTTRWSAIRCAGIKPLALAALLFAWLLIGGAAVNMVVTAALR
jgi:uncharacterized integral membrane protein (TIGR00698 family)